MTYVSIVSVVYFEKACLINFLISYPVFPRECIILWVEKSAWIFFSKVRNTKARTECKVVIIKSSERGYQGRCCSLLLVLNKFHFYFLEFSRWVWTCTWLQECNWDLRNQHERNCLKSAIRKLEQRVQNLLVKSECKICSRLKIEDPRKISSELFRCLYC